jgi:hypothetical protein
MAEDSPPGCGEHQLGFFFLFWIFLETSAWPGSHSVLETGWVPGFLTRQALALTQVDGNVDVCLRHLSLIWSQVPTGLCLACCVWCCQGEPLALALG